MTWAKVDDNLAFHVKVLRAGNLAMGLWVRALSYCAQQQNDGLLPSEMVGALGGSQADADSLVAARLWHETLDGYQFHEWEQRQPTREKIEQERADTRNRQQEWRSRNALRTRDKRVSHTAPTGPDPTRKEPEHSTAAQRSTSKKGTRLSSDWQPSAELHEYTRAKAPAVDVAVELENFRDWWAQAAGAKGVKLDWDATWRTWVRRAQSRAAESAPRASTSRAVEQQIEDRARISARRQQWLDARGITLAEYEQHKTDQGWLDAQKELPA